MKRLDHILTYHIKYYIYCLINFNLYQKYKLFYKNIKKIIYLLFYVINTCSSNSNFLYTITFTNITLVLVRQVELDSDPLNNVSSLNLMNEKHLIKKKILQR